MVAIKRKHMKAPHIRIQSDNTKPRAIMQEVVTIAQENAINVCRRIGAPSTWGSCDYTNGNDIEWISV